MNLAKRYPGSENSLIWRVGASQIRVEQNKEPAHFLKIFKGKLLVHKGSVDEASQPVGLYQIRGNNTSDSLAIEVDVNLFSYLIPF